MSTFDTMFTTTSFVEHLYYEKKLPFEINPTDFIEWLSSIGEEIYEDNYGMSVTSMCEYSCLWITKLAYNIAFDPSRLKVCYGSYGFGEHYWIMLDDEYFIDLTLMQFRRDSPELAITKKEEALGDTAYSKNFSTSTYIEYIEQFGIQL